jgi:hypothetical protein
MLTLEHSKNIFLYNKLNMYRRRQFSPSLGDFHPELMDNQHANNAERAKVRDNKLIELQR